MKCQRCYGTGYIAEQVIPPPIALPLSYDWKTGTIIVKREECPDCNGTGKVYGVQPPTQQYLTAAQAQRAQALANAYIHKRIQQNIFAGAHWGSQMKWKNFHEEDPDQQLKKEMSRVLLDIAGESFFPSTQLYQLANALLIENGSEFLLGVVDEEKHFKEDWEVRNRMRSIEEEVAKIWLNEEKGILCARFPFKQNVIDAIHTQIPKGKKAWNPDDKLWEFSVEAVDVVVKILTESFQKVIDLTRPEPPMIASQNGGDPLLSLLDEEDINKIYKMLARKYHPDMGDGSDRMARINQIFKGRMK